MVAFSRLPFGRPSLSCFYRRDTGSDWEVCAEKVFDPEEVYRK